MTVLVGLLAAATVIGHILVAGDYGYAADELYLLACSERLAWGYVDVPPMAAHVTLLARVFLGSSLLGIRLGPAVAAGALVLLGALLARRFGGGRFASGLVALCLACGPVFVAANATLGPNAYAPLAATAFVYVLVGLVQQGRARAWFLLGWCAGGVVGLAPAAAVVVAAAGGTLILWSGREIARGPWWWAGACVAGILVAPALAWQAGNGWPILEFRTDAFAQGAMVLGIDVLARWNLVLALLALTGALALLFAPRLGDARVVGVGLVPLAAVAVLLAWDGATLLFLLPTLLAAGAVCVESLSRARVLGGLRLLVPASVALIGVLGFPLASPVLPLERVPGYAAWAAPLITWPAPAGPLEPLPERFAQMLGWEDVVVAARRALDRVPPRQRAKVAVWARHRADAAAVDRIGVRYGLPRAVSADGSYALWGTGQAEPTFVVAIGFSADEIQPLFRRQCAVDVVECALCEPRRRRQTVHLCESPRAPADRLWAELIPQLERETRIE